MGCTTEEIMSLRSELRIARNEASRCKAKLDLVGNYEREIDLLRDEVRFLQTEKNLLEDRLDRRYRPAYRSRSLSPKCYPRWRRFPSPTDCESPSPTRAERTNCFRHSRLVARFTDLYAINRIDMQDRLRRFVYDDDMVKRIIFIAVTESFQVAKLAYRDFRCRARKIVLPLHCGLSTLDEAITDYIVRNFDLYDVEKSVQDVIRSMNTNPKISYPPECNYVLLSPFIREACKIAFEMQSLCPSLDVATAVEGELFKECLYRRNYDSEFSAPLIAVHIWPALLEDGTVLIKGDCITRYGATYRPLYRRRW